MQIKCKRMAEIVGGKGMGGRGLLPSSNVYPEKKLKTKSSDKQNRVELNRSNLSH